MNNTEITAALRQMADEIDKSESQVDKQQWWRAERGDKFYYADPVNIYDPIEDYADMRRRYCEMLRGYIE